MRKRKRFENTRLIIERLEQQPAHPKQLSDELHIRYNTVINNLRKTLPALGLVEQLPDGKYTMRWSQPEEFKVREAYELLRKKLLRPPKPEEISGLIKCNPEDARQLLFKYIPSYREPSEDELISAADALFRTILIGQLIMPTKKQLFERGITRLTFEGIDQKVLTGLWSEVDETERAIAQSYLKDFPDMAVLIDLRESGEHLSYRIQPAEPLRPWIGKALQTEIHLPARLNSQRYLRYKGYLKENRAYALRKIQEMATDSLPTPEVIDDLLALLREEGERKEVLVALKTFCRNGLEVEQVDDTARTKVLSALWDLAFSLEGEYEDIGEEGYMEQEYAFEVVERLAANNSEAIARAKEFVLSALNRGYRRGNYLMRVAKWLAKDPALKEELMDRAEMVLLGTSDKKIADGCRNFLQSL